MPRNYKHIKEYEKEIFELKEKSSASLKELSTLLKISLHKKITTAGEKSSAILI